jgi:hypothetical protein
MREEEYLILQNKFRDWFGDLVPADTPLPAEIDRSIEGPVSADAPLPAEIDQIKRKRRVNKSEKLLELVLHGFGGAISFGAVVGLIIYILNLSIWRWSSYNWLIQFLVIFFVMVIGFYISLRKVLTSQKRD